MVAEPSGTPGSSGKPPADGVPAALVRRRQRRVQPRRSARRRRHPPRRTARMRSSDRSTSPVRDLASHQPGVATLRRPAPRLPDSAQTPHHGQATSSADFGSTNTMAWSRSSGRAIPPAWALAGPGPGSSHPRPPPPSRPRDHIGGDGEGHGGKIGFRGRIRPVYTPVYTEPSHGHLHQEPRGRAEGARTCGAPGPLTDGGGDRAQAVEEKLARTRPPRRRPSLEEMQRATRKSFAARPVWTRVPTSQSARKSGMKCGPPAYPGDRRHACRSSLSMLRPSSPSRWASRKDPAFTAFACSRPPRAT